MHSSTNRGLGLASHGIALAIGLLGGLVLLDHHGPGLGLFAIDPPPPPPAPTAHARVVAVAWLDQGLAKVKADHKESGGLSDREKLPILELLKQYRRELDEERAEISLRLDAIVDASSRYRDQSDPAAAMRAALKNQTDEGTDSALAIFHAWRERDRDAALACLGRSWRLLDELYVTSALLEREFGRDWMAQQLRDDKLPYRMRRTIASGLATHLAWDAGLAGFITCYQTITDPELKDRFWERFADEWRLEDPPEVARILTKWTASMTCFVRLWFQTTGGTRIREAHTCWSDCKSLSPPSPIPRQQPISDGGNRGRGKTGATFLRGPRSPGGMRCARTIRCATN